MPDVLLMAYGTPYTPAEILPYYTDIRHGKAPSPELLAELQGRYAAIGKSPLNEITMAQASRLQARLGGASRVWVGMKHWWPTIAMAITEMAAAGVKEAIALVAAPHYSSRSVAEYQEQVNKSLTELNNPFSVRFIESYHDHPAYLAAAARRVEEALWYTQNPREARVIFTAHSIPLRAVQNGDPYPEQLRATAELVAQSLGPLQYSLAFQSAGRTPEPWLGPDINERIAELAAAGVKECVVAAVGFPADHLEVLYDLDLEAQAKAAQLGVRLVRARSLNADPDYIEALAQIVEWA